MSGEALRDHNALSVLDSEKKPEKSTKGCFVKHDIENASEETNKDINKLPEPLVSAPLNVSEGTNGCAGTPSTEVEYIDSEDLKDLACVETSLNTLLARLDSKNWVTVCEALNNVRQISIFHKERLLPILCDVLKLVVKSLKNPRSAVCKTAIMTSADIFRTCSDSVIDSLDPMLLQLFLKSSQDKRFVCEAAENALVSMTTFISSSLLLPNLQPYLKHRNPRIRAKASMCFCRSVLQLGSEGINSYGIDKLIQVAANQLSDQLPESREAARGLALELQTAYEKYQDASIAETADPVDKDSWESFCQSKLSPLNAQAMLRVTTSQKDGIVVNTF